MKIRDKNYYFPIILASFFCIAAFINGIILPDIIAGKILGFLKGYLSKISFSFWGIFLNNLMASIIIFFGGLIFALPSMISCYSNFLILGVTFRIFWKSAGLLKIFSSILPHGIFELPAVFIAFILALNIAIQIVRSILSIESPGFSKIFKRSLMIYIKIVIPLLLIAAFIEVYLTPRILKYLGFL